MALAAPNSQYLVGQADHFTRNEAEHRDGIVLGYFGREGVARIASVVADEIGRGRMPRNPVLLDVGAGIGTFTIPILSRVRARFPDARAYALDLTPAMLKVLSARAPSVVPILGIAEDIAGSIDHAKKHFAIPDTFDAIFSTLTLHHCPDLGTVFKSFHHALRDDGEAVIVDLCRHPFSEFREEMGDYHMGFDLQEVRNIGSEHFEDVTVKKLSDSRCVCSSSGRSAELFVATLRKRN